MNDATIDERIMAAAAASMAHSSARPSPATFAVMRSAMAASAAVQRACRAPPPPCVAGLSAAEVRTVQMAESLAAEEAEPPREAGCADRTRSGEGESRDGGGGDASSGSGEGESRDGSGGDASSGGGDGADVSATSVPATRSSTTGGAPPADCLSCLMRVDALLPKHLLTELHTFYLLCLPDMAFKRAFAFAFCRLYLSLAVQYAGGIGTRDETLFGYSVQLFTTPSVVQLLLSEGLLGRVILALDFAIHTASTRENGSGRHHPWVPDPYGPVPSLDCDATPLYHRRYEFLVRDLEYVLTIDGVSRGLVGRPRLLRTWMRTLLRLQGADSQVRYVSAHIEHDSRAWIHAFNLHLSLSSAFHNVLKPLADCQPAEADLKAVALHAATRTLPAPLPPPEAPPRALHTPPALAPPPPEALHESAMARAVAAASHIGASTVRALAAWLSQQTFQLLALPLPPPPRPPFAFSVAAHPPEEWAAVELSAEHKRGCSSSHRMSIRAFLDVCRLGGYHSAFSERGELGRLPARPNAISAPFLSTPIPLHPPSAPNPLRSHAYAQAMRKLAP